MKRRRAGKRLNGEGSFKQLDTGWKLTFTVGTTPDGNLIRKSVNGRTQAECLRRKEERLHELRCGKPVTSGDETVEHYLTRWLEDRVKRTIRASTYRRHQSTLASLYPLIGAYPLVELHASHIQQAYAQLATYQKPPTISRAAAVLSQALEGAVQWDLIPKNPARYARPPKVEKVVRRVLTREDADHLYAVEREHGGRYEALWVLLATCGLRRGEALAARWDDLDGDRLHVRTGKTRAAERDVPLPPPAQAALARHKTRQNTDKIKNRDVWTDTGLIFTTALGTQLSVSTVRWAWERALQRAQMPHIRLHDLRRTAIAWMREAGVDADVVQKVVGHEKLQTTLDVYGTVSRSRLDEARRKMATYLQEA